MLVQAELWGTLEELHARHHYFQTPGGHPFPLSHDEIFQSRLSQLFSIPAMYKSGAVPSLSVVPSR